VQTDRRREPDPPQPDQQCHQIHRLRTGVFGATAAAGQRPRTDGNQCEWIPDWYWAGGSEQVVEAFSQVDMSAARRHEGTGLGLHLSQKLAELLGGRITFYSTYGQGSTFTVTIPGSLSRPPD